mmetsp:Transcript_95140/g.182970  ORF Transcript_95140/g.182970 Transcript_95140/m.182970 type:complete len:255 (-) Transcript_95140:49-813(-)
MDESGLDRAAKELTALLESAERSEPKDCISLVSDKSEVGWEAKFSDHPVFTEQLLESAAEAADAEASEGLQSKTVGFSGSADEQNAVVGAEPANTGSSGRGVPRVLYAMSPWEARELLRYQRGVDAVEERPPPECREEGANESGGKMVIDPCLGRCQVLRAKALLGVILLGGVIYALAVGLCGRRWLQHHLATGELPVAEASVVVGLALPVLLALFLAVLEHCEWQYVKKVSPQTNLGYTPLLHKLWPALRGSA